MTNEFTKEEQTDTTHRGPGDFPQFLVRQGLSPFPFFYSYLPFHGLERKIFRRRVDLSKRLLSRRFFSPSSPDTLYRRHGPESPIEGQRRKINGKCGRGETPSLLVVSVLVPPTDSVLRVGDTSPCHWNPHVTSQFRQTPVSLCCRLRSTGRWLWLQRGKDSSEILK